MGESKASSHIVPVMAPQPTELGSQLHSRAPGADQQAQDHYAALAHKTWLKSARPPRVLPAVVKDQLWDRLEKDGFAYGSLLALETLQLLERYLWPGYTEHASNYHVLLLAIIVNVKRRENLPVWTHFASKPDLFSSFFRRVLSMTVDLSLPTNVRTHLISFVIAAYQSLDDALVRKECAPLVSMAIWHNLHGDSAREDMFNAHLRLRKVWRAAVRRYEQADEKTQARLRFDRAWLYSLVLDFLNQIYGSAAGEEGKAALLYCERFMELLIDLQSQLPTRRYVNTLLRDLNALPAITLSVMYNDRDNAIFRDLYALLEHYTTFPIDDHEEKQLSAFEHYELHSKKLARLQRIGFKHFESNLKILALSNYGSLSQRTDLESHFEQLDLAELKELCTLVGLRTEYPATSQIPRDAAFYKELLLFTYVRRRTFQETARDLKIVPTEEILYDPAFLRNEEYVGSRPLAIPKLNLQYLTVGDFLWRSFILHRCELFYAIRQDVEDAIKRLRPRTVGGTTRFDGSSKMALEMTGSPAITDVAPPRVGEFVPAHVRSEVIVDIRRLPYGTRREWQSLRPGEVVFLLAVRPAEKTAGNGFHPGDAANQMGLRYLRAAEVVQVQDEKGRPMREENPDAENEGRYRPQKCRYILNLDAQAYKEDLRRKEDGQEVYGSMNVLLRRRARENNFKPVLESVKKLTLSDVPAPDWFRDVFLGYGDPNTATYRRLSNRLKSVDFRDTFLDWQHLVESFPGKSLEPSDDMPASCGPPYILEYVGGASPEPDDRPSKKRRREPEDSGKDAGETMMVSTYKPPNNGPYPIDAPKLNRVRFTPAQIEAISSGTQPGLTVIVGPPGTGKTDVATQIINNIYHNFPSQRTLLIAHSNQALNQLFQKIIALDIDERHLLRLGHGEEELETESNYSKYGRVESFLERGTYYLSEVKRLAENLNAPGAHHNSCETADYFNSVYVKPTWTKYWDSVQAEDAAVQDIIEAFPFHRYFSTAPQPLFPPGLTKERALDILAGCYRHIEKIFSELADIRPFEVLQHGRDKADYLLIKEARIIAMTSTHAAMRRQAVADLGFRYDNVVIEEAAQITELESFIPLAMQRPRDGALPLQRVVLVGDHLQNAPVIQSRAFRQYANLEQSLFLRLVRLGVPTVTLDAQGRARAGLAALYRWRYPDLRTLPSVLESSEFQRANAGFRYEYQFVNVEDYKGQGETEPSPHFVQNLGEAEYAVAIFMYMRLLGYPAHKISILAMYAGQRALIRDVLAHRCKSNRLFGMPRHVSTVDKFQGEQNDYIILSLTRTSRPGYLRDARRLTVALSRARLGLYVLGRRAAFERVAELREAFARLFARSTELALVTGEMWPATRGADPVEDEEEGGEAVEGTVVMAGVEHLGQYVFEMTKAKVQMLKDTGGKLPALAKVEGSEDESEEEGEGVVEIVSGSEEDEEDDEEK